MVSDRGVGGGEEKRVLGGGGGVEGVGVKRGGWYLSRSQTR